MSNYEIRTFTNATLVEKEQVRTIFVDCFYDVVLHNFGTKDDVRELFADFLQYDAFLGLYDGDVLLGFLAYTTGTKRVIQMDIKKIRKKIGWLKGTILYKILVPDFQRSKELSDKTCFIEFIGTASDARGKGVATALVNYLEKMDRFESYILEVLDSNLTAKSLYEKLGFIETSRIKEKYGSKNGASYRITMELKKQRKRVLDLEEKNID